MQRLDPNEESANPITVKITQTMLDHIDSQDLSRSEFIRYLIEKDMHRLPKAK